MVITNDWKRWSPEFTEKLDANCSLLMTYAWENIINIFSIDAKSLTTSVSVQKYPQQTDQHYTIHLKYYRIETQLFSNVLNVEWDVLILHAHNVWIVLIYMATIALKCRLYLRKMTIFSSCHGIIHCILFFSYQLRPQHIYLYLLW